MTNFRSASLLALAVSAVACDPVGRMQGTVVEAPTKTPVADADVTMDCGRGGTPVKTDAQGRYEATQVGFLDPKCTVEAKRDGYEAVRTPMGDRCAEGDKERCYRGRVDLQLTPKK